MIDFLNLIENLSGKKVKQFLSDNGGEFVNHTLSVELRRRGIEFLTTTPYTSQQNGKVERRNRTIQDCARTLLHNAGMPAEYWPVAVTTANYLINRWSTKRGLVP